MTQEENALKAALARPMDGEAVIRALRRICSERGWALDYLPVSVAVVGSEASERKVYEDVEVRTSTSKVKVRAGAGELERGKDIGCVMLLPFPPDDDAASVLVDLLRGVLPREGGSGRGAGPAEDEARYVVPGTGDYSLAFRVLVILQGPWGERIASHLQKSSPLHWQISILNVPAELPMLVDDPSAYLPREVPGCDLILLLSEHPSTPQIVPDLVKASRARALIAPIDNPAWLPAGEARKLSRLLGEWGVEAAFPRPFCSLTEVGTPTIDEFARRFGAPSVEVQSEDGRTVTRLLVRRGAPCGCTAFVAEGMAGMRLEEAVGKAGLLHHHYPCLASMAREEDLGDTLMHISGLDLKKEVEKEVWRFRKEETSYLDPGAT